MCITIENIYANFIPTAAATTITTTTALWSKNFMVNHGRRL
jgi:hypothetical protein